MSTLDGKLERQETHAGRARCSWLRHMKPFPLTTAWQVLREDEKGPLALLTLVGWEPAWWRRAHVDAGDVILEACTQEEAAHAGEAREEQGPENPRGTEAGLTKSTGPRAKAGRAATRRG